MKAFKIVPSIAEYVDFRTLAKELSLGERDLILTNEYIYNRATCSPLKRWRTALFQSVL